MNLLLLLIPLLLLIQHKHENCFVKSSSQTAILTDLQDDDEVKTFVRHFPKFTLPYKLTVKHIDNAKPLLNSAFAKKLYGDALPFNFFAVALLKDCGNKKSLLAVEVGLKENGKRKLVFHLIELENESAVKKTIFDQGNFFLTDFGFENGCTVSASAGSWAAGGIIKVTVLEGYGAREYSAALCI